MFDVFEFIINLLIHIGEFFMNLIETLIFAIGFIFQGVLYVFTIITYLPPWVMPFVVAVIAWTIVLFIINK